MRKQNKKSKKQNIEIDITFEITQEDLELLHRLRKVSSYRRMEIWMREFQKKLPSYKGREHNSRVTTVSDCRMDITKTILPFEKFFQRYIIWTVNVI